MEISIETIISIAGLLLGGGGIGGWLSYRYTRRKEKAEADSAETAATKEVQDVYQQLITDVKTDRDEQRQYISELKDDRRHLREERDELRDRIDQTDEKVRVLQREVARNGRMVESLRPFICGLIGCKNRKPVTISEDGEAESPEDGTVKPELRRRTRKEKTEIEPINNTDL